MSLPSFRYHPDPLGTGSIEESPATCAACGQARGFIYVAGVYAEQDLGEKICPWCIADGSAATKFSAVFTDGSDLVDDVPEAVVKEVTERTPGYLSWQQDVWASCCNDACAFHGDATQAELAALPPAVTAELTADWGWDEARWKAFVAGYESESDASVHKFVCLKCGDPTFALDMA